MAWAGTEAQGGILRTRKVCGKHATGSANFAGLLVDGDAGGGGAAHRVGEDRGAVEQDQFGGADDVSTVGGGLTIGLLEVDVASFIELLPFAIGRKFGAEFGGFDDLRRGGADFSGDGGAAVAEQSVQASGRRELRDESSGVKSGGFLG